MRKSLFCFVFLATTALSLCRGFSLSSRAIFVAAQPTQYAKRQFPTTKTLPRGAPSALRQSLTSINGGGGGPQSSPSYKKVDLVALSKYSTGLGIQMALIFVFLAEIDNILASLSLKIPFFCNFLFFYMFNLKSSIFSILPNRKRSREKNSEGQKKMSKENLEYSKRTIPTWTPPGIAFVFGWPLLTFGLRAWTASMVVRTSGKYASAAIMSLMLHLGIGTLWNTVNIVERRLGVSVILLYALWLTKAFTAWQFYKITSPGGKLLAVTLTWLTAAVALETRTWQINPDPDNGGRKEPLVPMKHPKWTTKFRWE